MKYCQICGQPSGIYDLCQHCIKKLENGEVIKCAFCGRYIIPGTKCSCILEKEQDQQKDQEPTQQPQINQTIQITEEEDHPMKDGCAKGFGGGCGCLLAVAVTIGIIVFIALGMLN